MTDDEIRSMALQVEAAFRGEAARDGVGAVMRDVLHRYADIARCVVQGEYHRANYFRSIVHSLRELGDPMDDVETDIGRLSDSIQMAAENAVDDAMDLWAHCDDSRPTNAIVSRADDLMRALTDPDPCYIRHESGRLHDAVTDWIERCRDDVVAVRDIAREYRNACAVGAWEEAREVLLRSDDDGPKRPHGNVWDMPVKVIRQRPRANRRRPYPRSATVCLWPDGTETHAVPCKGDDYNPHTGLLVCLVKRMVALRGVSGLAKTIRDVEVSNGDMRADEGMSRAAAHRLALTEVGSFFYAKGLHGSLTHNPPTFSDYATRVARSEVKGIADAMAKDFRIALLRMRDEAAMRAERSRCRAEYERRTSALHDEAVAHGADEFEAWSYARDHLLAPICMDPSVRITEEEIDAIGKRAWEEARERIYGAGPR